MKIYVAIDDTDSLEAGATGQSANKLRRLIESKNWGRTESVTRHQLLLHPDVPYTSHNSSMCFIAELDENILEEFIDCAGEFLEKISASGSDPGLCIAVNDLIKKRDILISFGLKTKKTVITKEEAYKIAAECGIHLSEHGGTGQGVIGALAAVGLRMTGNDGRFQGRIQLKDAGQIMSAGEIINQSEIEVVQSIDGQILNDAEKVIIGNKIKTVLLEGKRKLLVFQENDEWHTCGNNYLKNY